MAPRVPDLGRHLEAERDVNLRATHFGRAFSLEIQPRRDAVDAFFRAFPDEGGHRYLLQLTERWASRMLGRSLAAARRGLLRWAMTEWSTLSGGVYRRVKGYVPLRMGLLVGGKAAADPVGFMAAKTEEWVGVWVDPVFGGASVVDGLGQLVAKAAEGPLDPVAVERLDVVLEKTPSNKAGGISRPESTAHKKTPPNKKCII